MTDITISPEAVEAAAKAIFDATPFREQAGELNEQSARYQALTRAYATAALRAGIAAWPGSFPHTFHGPLEGYGYVLPLPQETRDE